MKMLLAIIVGKIIIWITRTLKIGGGFAAPGLYALKIDPDLVEKLAKKIPKNIIITGTNGKTTTTRMIAHLCKESGLKIIRNHTGSNLERGIASTLISNKRLCANVFHPGGGIASHLGVWELDEAAFNTVAPKINPDIVVFLNVFRDQLDRYGETDAVIKSWCKTLKKLSKNTKILINGDDHNLENLATDFKGKIQRFGVENYKISGESIKKKKEKFKLDFEAKNIKSDGLKGSNFTLTANYGLSTTNFQLPLPGIYHIYDAVAALACTSYLKLPIHLLADSLTSFSPAFGRVEKFSLQPLRLHRKNNAYIFLIKNPVGATQVFKTIAPQLKSQDRILIALNDNLADGTDVSWIWDAGFEILSLPARNASRIDAGGRGVKRHGNLSSVIVSGSRAEELAVRLKYAGFAPEQIAIKPSLQMAFKEAQVGLEGRLFILPTYTAMLELQGILSKSGIKKRYWQED